MAALVDTNLLVYRVDPGFPDKQETTDHLRVSKTARHFTTVVSLLAIEVLAVATVLTGVATAQALRSELYVGGFTRPVAFVQDPSNPDVQFVVQQGGQIRVIQNSTLVALPFLDLTTSILGGGERGLLGMAFAPDYATSRRFFVNFTRAVDGHTVVARFRRSASNPLTADPSSRFDLTWSTGLNHIVQPYSNHNGGNIAFGPDGYLYIGMGDGGSGGDPQNYAQNPNSLLGKMLRIDVEVPDSDPQGFAVPADNPFLDDVPVAARPEIWAFGLRNPWRWSFDETAHGGTGALIIGDVGQGSWEEINYEPAARGARNYGWRVREGAHVYAGGAPAYFPLTDPIFELDRSLATSVTGGVVYRGSLLGGAHVGRYFFANFYGRVYSLALNVHPITAEATASDFTEHTSELGNVGYVSAFGVDSRGELYIVSWLSGEILRVLPGGPLPMASTLVAPSGPIGTLEPAYRWNAVTASESYYLWVTDRSGVRIRQWHTPAAAGCASGTGICSVTPSIAVAPGAATWWIQTWNRAGYGPWSPGRSFTTSVPAPATGVSPTGSIAMSMPSFTWNASSLATWYYLWVNDASGNRIRQWHTAAAAGCAAGTGRCTIRAGVRLLPGAARWWIQTWNVVGYGPWSVATLFTVTPPAAPTLVSPTGSIATTKPAYTWSAVATATYYYLWVEGSGGGLIRTWYTAAAVGCARARGPARSRRQSPSRQGRRPGGFRPGTTRATERGAQAGGSRSLAIDLPAYVKAGHDGVGVVADANPHGAVCRVQCSGARDVSSIRTPDDRSVDDALDAATLDIPSDLLGDFRVRT